MNGNNLISSDYFCRFVFRSNYLLRRNDDSCKQFTPIANKEHLLSQVPVVESERFPNDFCSSVGATTQAYNIDTNYALDIFYGWVEIVDCATFASNKRTILPEPLE